MVVQDDFIIKKYKRKNGRVNIHRWYRQYCITCNKDRGYLPRSRDGECLSCACKGRVISDDQRKSISKTLTGRKTGPRSLETRIKNGASLTGLSIEEYIKTKPKRELLRKIKKSLSDRLIRFVNGKRRSYNNMPFNSIDLVLHLESLFHDHPDTKDKMTWDNYGRKKGILCWELDHIIPLRFKNEDGSFYWNQDELSDFNSSTFKRAWSLDNIQPMWANYNWMKKNKHSGKYDDLYKILRGQ